MANEHPECKYECCRHEANRQPAEPTENPDVVIRRCGICKRRHFEATIDPTVVGLVEPQPE